MDDMRPEFPGIVFDSVPCRIDHLLVIVYQEKGIKVLPLKESPAYKYLLDGKAEGYLNYMALLKRRCNLEIEYTLERFQNLLTIVKKKGWRGVDLLMVDYHFVIRDGQHRASIFKYLGYTDLSVLKMRLDTVKGLSSMLSFRFGKRIF